VVPIPEGAARDEEEPSDGLQTGGVEMTFDERGGEGNTATRLGTEGTT